MLQLYVLTIVAVLIFVHFNQERSICIVFEALPVVGSSEET